MSWRVVLLSMEPPVAQHLPRLLESLGHRVVGLITVGEESWVRGMAAHAPPGCAVVAPGTTAQLSHSMAQLAPDLALACVFPWRLDLAAL